MNAAIPNINTMFLDSPRVGWTKKKPPLDTKELHTFQFSRIILKTENTTSLV